MDPIAPKAHLTYLLHMLFATAHVAYWGLLRQRCVCIPRWI